MKALKQFAVNSLEFAVKARNGIPLFVIFVSLIFCQLQFSTAVHAGAGSEGGDFLNLGIGARAVSMGGAFTGLANDVSAGYWNPGGLVQLDGTEVLTMYDSFFEGMGHIYLGLGKKLNGGGALGAQINYLTSGDISGVDESGNSIGNFNATSMAIVLTYSRYINKSMSYGINLKTLNENIAGLNGSGFGADLGLLYKGSEKLRLGFAIQNLGTGITYDGYTETSPFPMVVRGGISYYLTNTGANSFVLCADLSKISTDNSMGMGAGMEYRAGVLAFRGGILKSGDAMIPGAGIGIGSGNISFDIGAGQYENLGSTYKVSFIGKFGAAGTDKGSIPKSLKTRKSSTSKTKSIDSQETDPDIKALEAQYNQAIEDIDPEKAIELKKKMETLKEKKNLQKQYNKAIEDMDPEKAIEIKKKIDALDSK